MEGGKFFPNFIGEARIRTYYINPVFSLKTDTDMKTIWLNLETEKDYFFKKPTSAYKTAVIRVSIGKKNDFILYLEDKFEKLFEIFQNFPSIPIIQMIHLILNPNELGDKNPKLIEYIESLTSGFSIDDKNQLLKFAQFIERIPKETLPKLLDNPNYTLVFGNLDSNQEFENNVLTQKEPELKKHNLSVKDIEDCFNNVILSKNTFDEVFTYTGLRKILGNKLPQGGGVIFIDQGGTGKSEMKSSLKKMWKKLGGECLEKDGIAEFKDNVNYATLIRSWYYGFKGEENNGYDNEGLFNAAIRTKVPSLLIIDEADRFVRTVSSNGQYVDTGAEMIINEFKRYLTKRSKGGVVGYVVTIMIANVDEDDLNTQLKMGGERLKPIYFGPPTKENEWLELIEMYFKNSHLIFQNRNNAKDKLLTNLILKHNSLMSHEKYMISPRKFGSDFCEHYLEKYFSEEKEIESLSKDNRYKTLHSMLYSEDKSQDIKVHYENFIKHFIEDLLLKEVRLAGLNVEKFREEYFNFINNLDIGFNNTQNYDERNKDLKRIESEEFKEFLTIFNDPETQKILKAKTLGDLLNNVDLNNNNAKKNEWMRLMSRYKFQSLNSVYFNKSKCEFPMSKKLIEFLNKKIASLNPRKINIKTVYGNFDPSYFYRYLNGKL